MSKKRHLDEQDKENVDTLTREPPAKRYLVDGGDSSPKCQTIGDIRSKIRHDSFDPELLKEECNKTDIFHIYILIFIITKRANLSI